MVGSNPTYCIQHSTPRQKALEFYISILVRSPVCRVLCFGRVAYMVKAAASRTVITKVRILSGPSVWDDIRYFQVTD